MNFEVQIWCILSQSRCHFKVPVLIPCVPLIVNENERKCQKYILQFFEQRVENTHTPTPHIQEYI